eukprot:CAMPEP_0170452098 /NCGR_PEP_ID=MMETSP0123-20130129/1115_1 /TAXON_ID=182087 /ORGANISM="Favella ehrenbergii, Strain Fehren 1" /LENGTH=67 /DNA_ID=CAMNT_0010714001 /DNA_START=1880 /DNA_END=2083 /DNA_ORIENTATION=-
MAKCSTPPSKHFTATLAKAATLAVVFCDKFGSMGVVLIAIFAIPSLLTGEQPRPWLLSGDVGSDKGI